VSIVHDDWPDVALSLLRGTQQLLRFGTAIAYRPVYLPVARTLRSSALSAQTPEMTPPKLAQLDVRSQIVDGDNAGNISHIRPTRCQMPATTAMSVRPNSCQKPTAARSLARRPSRLRNFRVSRRHAACRRVKSNAASGVPLARWVTGSSPQLRRRTLGGRKGSIARGTN
jgi:hypothetical protein